MSPRAAHSEFTGNERDEIRRISREVAQEEIGTIPTPEAPELPTADEGQVLVSKGTGTPAEFDNQVLLVGADDGPDPPLIRFRYDNVPGRREHTIGVNGAAGSIQFGLTDKPTKFQVQNQTGEVYFGAQPVGTKLVIATDADIVVTPSGGGGAGKIDLGRRVTDDHPAVGAQTRCWSITGQTTPPFSVLVPGGASYRYAIYEDGRVERNGVVLAGVLTGAADPTAGDGIDGDLYINTTSGAWFGPKSGATWPAIP